jgi:hypothetical protein
MTKPVVIGAASLLFALGMAPAQAGPCADEITTLSKTMATGDAGSGPTSGAGQQTTGAGQHPPTATMSRETEGRAASPQDVQRQTMGQPTAADESLRTGQQRKPEATAALDRARMLDQQGKEAECMSAVQDAKQLSR